MHCFAWGWKGYRRQGILGIAVIEGRCSRVGCRWNGAVEWGWGAENPSLSSLASCFSRCQHSPGSLLKGWEDVVPVTLSCRGMVQTGIG